MNNKIKITLISFLLISSCETPDVKQAKKNEEESHCKFELSKEILESDNITALSLELGLKKENEELIKVMQDTTVTCDSLQRTWENFKTLVFKESE